MASQSSRGSRSSWRNASARRRTIVCSHGDKAVLRVSGTKENLGRRFCGCPHYDVGKFEEQENVQEDPEKAKLRRKVLFLKTELRTYEWRLKTVVLVALIGWMLLFCLLLQKLGGNSHHGGVPLNLG
ncbi:hypothetical protein PIB30_086129 [Stylosanthes scabra]|uniref:Zinc finger GRF-type domain-containing protein n=1 Tax=Stylosanthes scabra TaxID=79078 RepID=A0ABU6WSY5_9FABA|nr:hypothetical protein [Stylosanthes scabra]